ncbi:DUF3941 domain-containing protein [Bacillus taeanensis]|jgi:hypothetical protein|uniref:DUF3941 domain-containing protein n=1 Tax=Bacillus taeanensis TaxID=273032 RepID=A0A366XUE1_9BACI|nr:DUF3941 domain-containing protein [Bacillus taeanensis]RBW69517.1 DUF3941 domain-containing protein [Bacillus taeanensis]
MSTTKDNNKKPVDGNAVRQQKNNLRERNAEERGERQYSKKTDHI